MPKDIVIQIDYAALIEEWDKTPFPIKAHEIETLTAEWKEVNKLTPKDQVSNICSRMFLLRYEDVCAYLSGLHTKHLTDPDLDQGALFRHVSDLGWMIGAMSLQNWQKDHLLAFCDLLGFGAVQAESRTESLSTREGSIYFLYNEAQGLVKIGFSICPVGRQATIQSACACTLKLVKTIKGKTIKDEKAMHSRFSEYRHDREWFFVKGKLKDFLAQDIDHHGRQRFLGE